MARNLERHKAAYVPATESDERYLIQRAQQGDAAAVAELYHRHAPAIYRYFFFRVSDAATAEDLTSEVFLEVVKALPRYMDRGLPFAAWLFRIAHDRVVDYHRRTLRRATADLSESLLDLGPGPDAEAAGRDEARRLNQALTSLTDEQQTVVQLRFMEGFSLEETAQLMGKTTGAIKALQHRALNSLARKLRP